MNHQVFNYLCLHNLKLKANTIIANNKIMKKEKVYVYRILTNSIN